MLLQQVAKRLVCLSHNLNHMPQGALSCYAIHLEGNVTLFRGRPLARSV